MGLLLSFAIHNFDASDIFSNIRGAEEDKLEDGIGKLESRLGTIRHPGAMLILWNAIPQLTSDDTSMRYAVFKLFELLSNVSHRNQAILSGLGIMQSLFDRLCDARSDPGVSEKERHILQKLLRRLLEMGATTSEARVIFQKAIKLDETLDPDVLDVIRFGMKSRWPEHFSMESPAALLLCEDNMKGLPTAGFTFTVRYCNMYLHLIINICWKAWVWISDLPSNSQHALFTVNLPTRRLLTMNIRPDGQLELSTSANPTPVTLENSKISKARWTHVTLIHYPYRVSKSSIRELCWTSYIARHYIN